MTYRMCSACGKPIYRDQYEKEYIKRTQFGSLPDVVWYRIKYHTECQTVNFVCEECGKSFTVPVWESYGRKYCSKRCNGKVLGNNHLSRHRLTPPEKIDETKITKTCIVCGETFFRKRYADGKMVPNRDWNKQICCSRVCGITYLKNRKKYLKDK
ncbi:hypothetical protein KY326_03845 [Candidatus Woesearchaeota archaeon]|nr:hypothetical protein [Candidatus Woesearchaeota archaeon]